MIFIALIVFIGPIVMRLLWNKQASVLSILGSTMVTYGSWTIFYTLLVISNASVNTVQLLFILPILALWSFEISMLYRHQKEISPNQWWYWFAGFIVIFVIVNVFTYKVFTDAGTYLNFAIKAKLNNSLNEIPGTYRLSWLIAIASVFGTYNTQFFYSVFIPLFTSVFFFFVFSDLATKNFEKLKDHKVMIGIVLVASIVLGNSWWAVDSNMLTGVLAGLLVLLWATDEIKNKEVSLKKSIYLFGPLLCVGFSPTGISIVIPMVITIALIALIFCNSNHKYLALLLQFFTTILILHYLTKDQVLIAKLMAIYWTGIILGLIILFVPNRFLTFNGFKTQKYVNIIVNNKFYWITMAGGMGAVFCLIFFKFLVFGSFPTKVQNYINFMSLFWIWFVAGFALMRKKPLIFVYFLIINTSYIFFLVVNNTNLNIAPNYVIHRVSKVAYLVSYLFLGFLALDCFSKKWIQFLTPLIPIASSFYVVNPSSQFLTFFRTSVSFNNNFYSKEDFKLLEKYSDYKSIISEIESPFISGFNGRIPTLVRQLYDNRTLSGKPLDRPFFYKGFSNYDEHTLPTKNDHQEMISAIEKGINNGVFNIVIVKKDHSFFHNQNFAKYERVDANQYIVVYKLK